MTLCWKKCSKGEGSCWAGYFIKFYFLWLYCLVDLALKNCRKLHNSRQRRHTLRLSVAAAAINWKTKSRKRVGGVVWFVYRSTHTCEHINYICSLSLRAPSQIKRSLIIAQRGDEIPRETVPWSRGKKINKFSSLLHGIRWIHTFFALIFVQRFSCKHLFFVALLLLHRYSWSTVAKTAKHCNFCWSTARTTITHTQQRANLQDLQQADPQHQTVFLPLHILRTEGKKSNKFCFSTR